MKRALVLSLICLFTFGAVAFALPYLDFEQYLIPDGSAVAAGQLTVGVTFATTHIYEYAYPRIVRGGEQQFGSISFYGDLYVGFNDIWSIPSSPFFGMDFDLLWGFIGFGLQSEIGLGSDWEDWPETSAYIDYWDTNLEFGAYVSSYFTFWAGADFEFNDDDYFDVFPYLRFRIGDQ